MLKQSRIAVNPKNIGLCLNPKCSKDPKILDEGHHFMQHSECKPISLDQLQGELLDHNNAPYKNFGGNNNVTEAFDLLDK